MQFEEKLDVEEEDIAQNSRELLDIRLKDRTTNENIIWATSDYLRKAISMPQRSKSMQT